MVFEGVILQTAIYGGQIGDILIDWYNFGIFTYLLPFLLIFSLIFGIMVKINLFGEVNRGISGIIALTIGLMALQFDFVPRFFTEIFPRLGVGLAVLLAVIILLSFFVTKESWLNYSLIGIGAVILIIVLVKSAGSLGWQSGYWWSLNWPMVAGAIFIMIILAIIVNSGKPPGTVKDSLFTRALFEGR